MDWTAPLQTHSHTVCRRAIPANPSETELNEKLLLQLTYGSKKKLSNCHCLDVP